MKKLIYSIVILCITIQAFPQKYVQVWGDEFNKPGLPDSTKWDYEVGKLRNAELQYYTYRRSENARIQDTVLIIEARKEPFQGAAYTSASLISKYKGDWLYGKFEIRAKVPGGKGTWPAIWMMPTNSEYGGWPKSGEMDIMEYVGWDISKLYFTTHFEGTNGSGHQQSGTSVLTAQPFSRFITFTFVWTPTKLEWYGDNKLFHTYTKTSTDPKVWPFNKMFYMILNLAYGGSWGGQQGIDDTKLPHKFYIDYVRVYQLQETAGPFSLTIEPATGGTVEVSPKLASYPEGTMVTLTAKASEGYVFDKWLHQSSANPAQIEVNKNMTITPTFIKKNEVILNGNFDKGLDKWSSWFDQPSSPVFTTSVVDSIFVATITKPGTANWHIVEQQLNVPIIQGTSYNISFDAWAENPNTMDVFLSKNFGDYSSYYSTVKNISKTKQTFTWAIKMAQPTDYNCRFGFGFGKFTGKVYLDNVSIEKQVSTGNKDLTNIENVGFCLFPNPTSGEIIISGDSFNSPVTLCLFNLQGQLISTILNNQYLMKGNPVKINLKEQGASQGIYFLRLTTSDNSLVRKVILN